MPASPDPESLLAYDSFVRALARAILTDEHAVDDAVQQTWLGALCAKEPPRAVHVWLAAIVRNAARDALRRGDARERRERHRARAEAVPSMQSIFEREEARREIVDALDSIPADYRDALLLKYFEDLTPRAMAQCLGVNAETARTRVKRGLELLRAELARRRGGAGPAASALLPLAGWHLSFPSTPVLTMAAMTAKTKTAVALTAVLLTALGIWWALPTRSWTDHNAHDPGITIAELPAAAMESLTPSPVPATAPSTAPIREAAESRAGVASAPDADFGSLLVRVVWHDDTPAPGVGIAWFPDLDRNGIHYVKRFVTDSAGEFRVARVKPGVVWVCPDRAPWRAVEIQPSNEKVFLYKIPEGVDIEGSVVNDRREPVEGADVHLWNVNQDGCDVVVARSDARGRFAVRHVYPWMFSMYAVKEGNAPSPAKALDVPKRSRLQLTLELTEAGGELSGRVRDAEGEPVEGASVVVSDGAERGRRKPSADGSPAIAARPPRSLTNEDGRYVVKCLPIGESPVIVRAPGYALWRGKCNIDRSGGAALDVILPREVVLTGTVKDASGKPVNDAHVQVGVFGHPDYFDAFTKELDGSFRIGGLPTDPFIVTVNTERRGQASARLGGEAGRVLQWDAVLSIGDVLTGRVVDDKGSPCAGCVVRAYRQRSDPPSPYNGGEARTDSSGAFKIVSCPNDAMSVQVRSGDGPFIVKQVSNVLASEGPLTIVVKGGVEATARIRGRLVDPKGNPIAAAAGHLWQTGGGVGVGVNGDGSFEIPKLRAGAYSLKITAPNVGVWNSLTLRIETGETLDLGTVVIPKPGSLVVAVSAPDALKRAGYMVVVRQENARGSPPVNFEFEGSQSTPHLLQPGRHVVHVHTDGPDPAIASRDAVVDIRSGEETRVDMEVRPGARRTFVFTLPPGVLPMDDGVEVLRLVVKDGAGTLELDVDAPYFDEKASFGGVATFAKGTHKFEATTTRGFRVSGEFTIDAPSSAPETVRAVLSR